ncbi:hypothetical protein ACFVW8_17035 [Streptomyces sp. NPDC058221]|uniref:hypothetical protein n=1 Tax=Streptomyces sp. NPDC058221 TaxID=3346388 RepID=UPI0036E3B247
MPKTGTGKRRRHDRPRTGLTVYIVVIGMTGGAVGAGTAFSWREHPALTAAALVLLTVAVGTVLGMHAGRSTARQIDVPAKSLRPLLRRIQRADIPDSPEERAAMSRVLAHQRTSVAKLARFRWAHRALAMAFVAGAAWQLLDGPIWQAAVLLVAGTLQFLQPLFIRRSTGRLNRAEVELGRREAAASRPPG